MLKKAILRIGNNILIILLMMLFISILLLSLHNSLIPRVSIDNVRYDSSITEVIKGNGKVVFGEMHEIYVPKDMFIEDVFVRNGEYVEAGTTLIRFEESGYNIGNDEYIIKYQNDIEKLLAQASIYKINLNIIDEDLKNHEAKVNNSIAQFKTAEVLFENGLISREEYNEKKEFLDQEELLLSRAYNDFKIKRIEYEVQLAQINNDIADKENAIRMQSKINHLSTNLDGELIIDKPMYIEYINTTAYIAENELLIRYAYNDENRVEIILENDKYEAYDFDQRKNSIFINEEKYDVNILSISDFGDTYTLEVELVNEAITVSRNDIITFESTLNISSDFVVNKTAVASVGGIKKGNTCYLYGLKKTNGILGEYFAVSPIKCNIVAVGEKYISFYPVSKEIYIGTGEFEIIDYPDRVYHLNMKVKKR